jgi:hypothetical protein
MSDHTTTSIVSVLLAITGLAALALLVSGSASTSNVLGSFGSSISRMICVALSPVTGGNCGGGNTPSVNSTITFGGPRSLF